MLSNEKPKSGKRTFLARAGLLLAVLGGALLVTNTDRSQPVSTPMKKQAFEGRPQPVLNPKNKQSVEEWREKFPFVSLGNRLDYETSHTQVAQALLNPEDMKRVEEQFQLGGLRIEALRLLHSEEADQFIQQGGFGFERMPLSSTYYRQLQIAPTLTPENVSYTESSLENDPEAKLPIKGSGVEGPSRLLSLETLLKLHWWGQEGFLARDSFGYVKSREQVSGFEAHHFQYDPSIYALNQNSKEEEKKAKERWVMRRLELVSLLKFEKPVVYLSAHLPRMQDIKNQPVRELSVFEEKALKQLQAGEDLVTEATTNRIHMMGSLRAGKQCLECHHGQYGQLLGSFSYDILRDPPLVAGRFLP
jgi:hypothetical protein